MPRNLNEFVRSCIRLLYPRQFLLSHYIQTDALLCSSIKVWNAENALPKIKFVQVYYTCQGITTPSIYIKTSTTSAKLQPNKYAVQYTEQFFVKLLVEFMRGLVLYGHDSVWGGFERSSRDHRVLVETVRLVIRGREIFLEAASVHFDCLEAPSVLVRTWECKL